MTLTLIGSMLHYRSDAYSQRRAEPAGSAPAAMTLRREAPSRDRGHTTLLVPAAPPESRNRDSAGSDHAPASKPSAIFAGAHTLVQEVYLMLYLYQVRRQVFVIICM